jgi:hypothetical protein
MATNKPNVLLIRADDIGWFGVDACHRGIMETRTVPAAIVHQHAATFAEFPPHLAPPGIDPQAISESVTEAAARLAKGTSGT